MSKREADYNENNKMVVSNSYVHAIHPYNMSLNAMKLFRLVVTQCRLKDEEFFEYDFKIIDLAEAFHIKSQNLYRDVKQMCRNMSFSVLYVGDDDDPENDWEYKPIFSECKYQKKSGKVTIQLNPKVTDLFLKLKSNFTKVPISAVLLMKSKYAIRLFELLCEKMRNCLPYADNATEVTLTLKEIRKATGTDKKKTYDILTNLKKRVFYPSIEEIETASEWKIICSDIKNGRTVTGFRLEIWSRAGWEYIESCKAQGILPNYGNREYESQIEGQMSIFDYMKGGEGT